MVGAELYQAVAYRATLARQEGHHLNKLKWSDPGNGSWRQRATAMALVRERVLGEVLGPPPPAPPPPRLTAAAAPLRPPPRRRLA